MRPLFYVFFPQANLFNKVVDRHFQSCYIVLQLSIFLPN